MRTVNSILINSEIATAFDLAVNVERWPEIMDHYRWVRKLGNGPDHLHEMAARRGWIPVKWVSFQDVAEAERQISYVHVGGPTEGMRVKWIFRPTDRGIEVVILHEMSLIRPFFRMLPVKWVIGELFVKSIADKTLGRIRDLAEDRTCVT